MLLIHNIKLLHNFSRNLAVFAVSQNNIKPVDLAFFKYENPNTTNNLPPLFIMHGLFGSKKSWRSTCQALVKKIHKRIIYSFDARNHGDSPHTKDHRYEDMAADIVQFMKKEDVKQIAAMGHSMGGKCIMYMALKYPHLVEKAIIIDITPVSPSESLNKLGIILKSLKRVKISSKLEMPYARKLADEQLQKFNVTSKQTREFILTNLIQTPNKRYGWRVNVEALDKSFAMHIAKFPDDVRTSKYLGPVLFIGGTDNNFISDEQMAAIRTTYFPEARLISLPKTGHLVHIEQQHLLIDLVVSFLY